MTARNMISVGAILLLSLGPGTPLGGQVIPGPQRVFNERGLRPHGQNVIPVYDGWFENEDGTRTMCFAYFNMNTEEALDIPLGPLNHIEPARYDGMQPTHFDPVPDPELTSPYRHHWCIFTVTVPADFDGRVVWSLTSQGTELSVPGKIIAPYILEEPQSTGRGQVAPDLKLDEDASWVRGRKGVVTGPRTVAVGEPLTITAWVMHPDSGTWLGWTKHQGPGVVEFSKSEIRVQEPEGSAETTAQFSEPGDYILRVQAINDTESPKNPTGGFEFHCCWTNGYVKVRVTN